MKPGAMGAMAGLRKRQENLGGAVLHTSGSCDWAQGARNLLMNPVTCLQGSLGRAALKTIAGKESSSYISSQNDSLPTEYQISREPMSK